MYYSILTGPMEYRAGLRYFDVPPQRGDAGAGQISNHPDLQGTL